MFVDNNLRTTERSPLPIVRNVTEDEEMGAVNQLDRMTIWLRNVESKHPVFLSIMNCRLTILSEVVEDARQNFAASVSTPLPPLPVAPVARPPSSASPASPSSSMGRSQRSTSRVPRKILAANQIFANEYDTSQMDRGMSSPLSASTPSRHLTEPVLVERRSMVDLTIPTIPDENSGKVSGEPQVPVEVPVTPQRKRVRRATIVTRSPEAERTRPSLEIDVDRRKEKSRSQHDLGRPITPVTKLAFELEQRQ